MKKALVFLWDNYGPMHIDRINAVHARFGAERKVIGIELLSKSEVYDWIPNQECNYEMITLCDTREHASSMRKFIRLVRRFWNEKRGLYFVSHYEKLEVFLFSSFIRISGGKVFLIYDSKFDDYRRYLWREVLKTLFMLPYQGAIAGGLRTIDYLRLLGVREDRVHIGADALAVDWWRSHGQLSAPPAAADAAGRPFICIARFVKKKNLPMLIDAYALYRSMVEHPRDLELCGSGVLEQELRERVKGYGLQDCVHFRGFLQRDDLVGILSRSLALILPSIEEQFGCVVAEAQACGIPVILSENCGARDILIRSGVNGFVIEPDNPKGLAFFMSLLCQDSALWARMAEAAWNSADAGDIARFVEAVALLTEASDP